MRRIFDGGIVFICLRRTFLPVILALKHNKSRGTPREMLTVTKSTEERSVWDIIAADPVRESYATWKHFATFLSHIVITCSLKIHFNIIRLFTFLSCTSSLPFRFSIKYSLYIFITHTSAHYVFVNFVIRKMFYVGRYSVVGISTHYGLVRWSNPGWGENICLPPDCQTAPLLPSVARQQNLTVYWREGSTPTAISPTSAPEVLRQHNKIGVINFGATLVFSTLVFFKAPS